MTTARYNDILRYMGKLIKELDEYRLENRITQVELADMLNVAFVTVSRWLNGHSQPNKIQTYHIKKLLASKEQEREGFSIPAQQKLLRDYATKNDIEVVKEFTDVETAKVAGRREFGKMVEFLKNNIETRIVLVEKTDRLYRNFRDYVLLEDIDLEIHLVKEGEVISKDSKSHAKFIHGVKLLMAKNYIDNLSEEVKKGMREKAEQGEWPNKAPLGYLNNKETHLLDVDPDRAPIISKLFELYSTGQHSITTLHETSKELGLKYKNTNRYCSRSNIERILKNPIYTGRFLWKGKLFRGIHDPIITEGLFDEVQAQFRRCCKPKSNTRQFAFKGLLTCGHCGCVITAELKKGKYVYYRCTNGKGKCKQPYIREEKLAETFAEVVGRVRIDSSQVDDIRKALKSSFETEKEYRSKEIAKLKRELVRLQVRLDQTYFDKIEGRIDTEFWRKMHNKWISEQNLVSRRIEELTRANRNYYEQGVNFLELAQTATSLYLSQTIDEKAKLLRSLLSNCTMMGATLCPTYNKPFNLIAEGGAGNKKLGFRDALLHNLKPDEFADMYAQTICYGLFSARCEHRGREPFSRQKAAFELPKTNPFLRTMFGHMAGPELDPRVDWIVDNLAELLNRADMEAILRDFGKRTGHKDPILHFYETFLAAYDPKMREARGVYYTPEQVVSYIVRSVDHILKTDFNLPDGLADSSKVTVNLSTSDKTGKPKTGECHKVLILDPAVGTGTFLHTVIDHIHEYIVSKRQGGMWSGYVSEHLLPRIFGFELLMAPYTITHMKLSLQLKDKNYDFNTNERLGVYLTNTLEEAFHITEALPFTRWITEEANAAGEVKRDKPVMVVIGNPPYSGHSQTPNERQRRIDPGQKYEVDTKLGRKTRIAMKTMYRKEKTFIGNLIQDYFQVDGKRLREQNPKYLYDDYVKFIRFAQWRIQQTGYGVLAFITNHGYLDNPTFRGMRQNLMSTFDDIYVLDLHGNTKKKEKCPDGSKDENVFDIQQGVAIGIFVKQSPDNLKHIAATVAHVHHADLWGLREVQDNHPDSKSVRTETKYGWLAENSLDTTEWTKLKPDSPFYLFVPQNTELREEYERGWKVTDCIPLNSTGIKTHRDHFVLDFDYKSLHNRIHDFRNLVSCHACIVV